MISKRIQKFVNIDFIEFYGFLKIRLLAWCFFFFFVRFRLFTKRNMFDLRFPCDNLCIYSIHLRFLCSRLVFQEREIDLYLCFRRDTSGNNNICIYTYILSCIGWHSSPNNHTITCPLGSSARVVSRVCFVRYLVICTGHGL